MTATDSELTNRKKKNISEKMLEKHDKILFLFGIIISCILLLAGIGGFTYYFVQSKSPTTLAIVPNSLDVLKGRGVNDAALEKELFNIELDIASDLELESGSSSDSEIKQMINDIIGSLPEPIVPTNSGDSRGSVAINSSVAKSSSSKTGSKIKRNRNHRKTSRSRYRRPNSSQRHETETETEEQSSDFSVSVQSRTKPAVSTELTKKKSRHVTPAPNAAFGAGMINPGHRCFIHSLIQLLYHCPAFRASLAAFIRANDGDNSVASAEFVAAAKDLNVIFYALHDAPPGGIVEFDFGISEPVTDSDALVARLLAYNVEYSDITRMINDRNLLNEDRNFTKQIVQRRYNRLPSELITELMNHLKPQHQVLSNVISVQSAIPEFLKTGQMDDPSTLLEFYQSFLNFDAFNLEEYRFQRIVGADIESNDDLILKSNKILDLFFPSSEEDVDIAMADLITWRYRQSEGNVKVGDLDTTVFDRISLPLPENLIVKVTRAIRSSGGEENRKNESRILDSEVINLTAHLFDPSSVPDARYNLVSFTVHVKDHHYAVVKDANDTWYRFDDDEITALSHDDMLEEAKIGYIFMYHIVE